LEGAQRAFLWLALQDCVLVQFCPCAVAIPSLPDVYVVLEKWDWLYMAYGNDDIYIFYIFMIQGTRETE
jgi:hypothetical protein